MPCAILEWSKRFGISNQHAFKAQAVNSRSHIMPSSDMQSTRYGSQNPSGPPSVPLAVFRALPPVCCLA
ncbi:hypothetical protein LA080_013720 [Diaporthe eres]|nr:hypothetical protein LA080_013720 [Diaporthe eres]